MGDGDDFPTLPSEVEGPEDAFAFLSNTDGSFVIEAAMGRAVASALGLPDEKVMELIAPAHEMLPYLPEEDDRSAICVAELSNAVLVHHGGDRQTTSLLGRGAGADAIHDKAVSKLPEYIDYDV